MGTGIDIQRNVLNVQQPRIYIYVYVFSSALGLIKWMLRLVIK